MDNRLVLTVVFVTLSWMFVGSYANNNTTTMAPGTSNTTMVQLTTVNMTHTTNATSNMTHTTMAPNMTTGSNNMTHTTMAPNMTTGSNNMTHTTMAPNMTTGSNNMTHMTMAPNMTTGSNNMTNATMAPNMTTAPNNMTNATMAPNVTMMATAAPPLEPNTTVVPLVQNISNSGCGTEQLCGSQPDSCNPSVAGECFFVAAKQESGRNFGFSLSGESDGYLAASVSPDNQLGGNDSTYVCANNNGTIQFFSALLNNGQLNLTTLRVNNVKGKVIGRRIQCTFSATLPEQRARAENFALGISTGKLTSTGDLGTPNVQFRSNVVNLANPNATVTNLNNVNATTPAVTTPQGTTSSSPAITPQQSLTQALLITVGVLSLALL